MDKLTRLEREGFITPLTNYTTVNKLKLKYKNGKQYDEVRKIKRTL